MRGDGSSPLTGDLDGRRIRKLLDNQLRPIVAPREYLPTMDAWTEQVARPDAERRCHLVQCGKVYPGSRVVVEAYSVGLEMPAKRARVLPRVR
jgi:hypothetical protein